VPTNSAETVREFYRRQGEERERVRIIAIIEEDSLCIQGCGCCSENSLEDLIALIKKEKLNEQV
jgi:ATP-dependent exoDNAse (exonuclease V) alpha subunit